MTLHKYKLPPYYMYLNQWTYKKLIVLTIKIAHNTMIDGYILKTFMSHYRLKQYNLKMNENLIILLSIKYQPQYIW